MSTEATVRELVSEHREPPADGAASLELASLEMVILAEALEQRFSIRVGARDLSPEHFGSIERIVRFVEGRVK
jgi:acyl carrier protein